jgi:uncharacterized membrane protein
MKKYIQAIIVILLAALPLFYLLKVYPSLPSIIPTHFGFDGKPNGFSEKEDLIWIVLSLSLISIGAYFLIRNLPRFDPKKTASQSAGKMQKITIAVVALLSVINILIIYSSIQRSISFSKMFNPLMGIFFIVVGNLMYNIKPNYFVGIRIPWTLENQDNWRATHHIGGKLWILGGFLIIVSNPFLSGKIGEYFFMAVTIGLAIIPIIHSFVYFRNHKTST